MFGRLTRLTMAQLDALATHCRTASGDHGYMIWRLWGAGPPVVLLHGGSGTWRHWVRNIFPLGDYFSVFAPDLPGFGDSDLPSGVDTAEALADIACEGLDLLVDPPTPIRLAGFSFGGIVAGLVAARLGPRVTTLVLCGPNGLGLPSVPRPALERIPPDISLAEEREIQRRNLGRLMLADPAKADELAVDVHMENLRRVRFRVGDIPESDVLRRALPQIRARLVGIWGSEDAFVGPHLEERRRVLSACHPDLDWRVIEGAGHWAIFEAADRVNPILLEVFGAVGA